MHRDGESDKSSIASVPVSIAGFGSGVSLVSAVTHESDTSADEASLSGFLPRTASRDWRFGSRNNLMSPKSRDNLGKFSSSNLQAGSRFYPNFSPQPDDSLNLKGRLTSARNPSTLPLPIPQRKISSNHLGLNIPTRKSSLYNISASGLLRSSPQNATFERLNGPVEANAKFDLIIDKLSTGTKASLFPQVHKTSSRISPPSASPSLGLSNDIFVVLSPANSVTRPRISQENIEGIKNIFGMCAKKSDAHAVPSIPQRKPSGPNLF